ncbi:MAG: glycoside hydrolase family 88 protein [Lacisediminihabitans sp.]
MTLDSRRELDAERVLAGAQHQVWNLITQHPGQMPTFTEGGRWYFDDDSWAPTWTSGFLAGLVWIFADLTGDVEWRKQAEKYCRLLEPRKLDKGTHDIGFLFTPSWGRWHALDPSEETSAVLIQAGRTMAERFNTAGKYLRTWVDAGSTFIDVMMNIGIIYQAAALSGDQRLADIATAHAMTSRRYLVRGDSSTAHEGWFDPESGEFLRAATHQGYRSDSTWVRGQAWAIYGFGTAFQWTGDEKFLHTARRCAELYIAEVGDRFVGPNDWRDPSPEFPYEASGASITASAMLQLSELLGEEGAVYRDYACGILARLSEPEFLGSSEKGWEGIIKHSTYHRVNGIGVDESVMWGDYYFVEALHRLVATRGTASAITSSRDVKVTGP